VILAVSMHFPSARSAAYNDRSRLILDSLRREVAQRSDRPSEQTRTQPNAAEDPLKTFGLLRRSCMRRQ
jgi:hypothetical protein